MWRPQKHLLGEAAERMSQTQLVEARTRAEVRQIEAQARTEVRRLEAQSQAEAERHAAQSEAEVQQVKTKVRHPGGYVFTTPSNSGSSTTLSCSVVGMARADNRAGESHVPVPQVNILSD